jgi:hypothetical protein
MISNLPSRWALALALTLVAVFVSAGTPGKLPVPSEAAQDKARKLVLEVFNDDLQNAKDPAARAKLAAELLQQGRDTKDDLTLRYVLLQEARDLAAASGDAGLAFSAIDDIAKTFAIDPLASKAQALESAVANADSKERGKDLLDLTLPMIAEALESDNYQAARVLGKVAESAARKAKSPSLVLDAQKRQREIDLAEKGFARQQGYLDRLKKDPKDAEANLELGKYYGLVKRHWDRALPYLAHGGDSALKSLAERDLAAPKDAVPQLALADAWWDLASKEQDPAKLAMQTRAAFWYDKAVGQLTGLSRTKAQKRLDQVAERNSGAAPVSTAPVAVGELKKLDGPIDELKGVSFAHDGQHIAAGGLDQTVYVWDLPAGKLVKTMKGHSKQIWAVAFHPNSRQVFTASWDTTVRLWDIKTASEVKRYTHPIDVNGLAVARDGNTFLSASDDKHACLWNTNTGDQLRRYAGHTNFVYAAAFAPDGRHIATGGVDRTVRLFELATGNLVRTCDSQTNSIYQVAFTSDSKHILSSGDNVIHVWDAATGKEVRRFEGHGDLVQAMAISPDGRRLVTGSHDRTVRLWDVASGKEIYRFGGHTEMVTCVAFSADGRRAASGSLDRTVRVWGLPLR